MVARAAAAGCRFVLHLRLLRRRRRRWPYSLRTPGNPATLSFIIPISMVFLSLNWNCLSNTELTLVYYPFYHGLDGCDFFFASKMLGKICKNSFSKSILGWRSKTRLIEKLELDHHLIMQLVLLPVSLIKIFLNSTLQLIFLSLYRILFTFIRNICHHHTKTRAQQQI